MAAAAAAAAAVPSGPCGTAAGLRRAHLLLPLLALLLRDLLRGGQRQVLAVPHKVLHRHGGGLGGSVADAGALRAVGATLLGAGRWRGLLERSWGGHRVFDVWQ